MLCYLPIWIFSYTLIDLFALDLQHFSMGVNYFFLMTYVDLFVNSFFLYIFYSFYRILQILQKKYGFFLRNGNPGEICFWSLFSV